MAKTSGGVRTYRQGSSTYRKRQTEVAAMRASGRYSFVEMGKAAVGSPLREVRRGTSPKNWKRHAYLPTRGIRLR